MSSSTLRQMLTPHVSHTTSQHRGRPHGAWRLTQPLHEKMEAFASVTSVVVRAQSGTRMATFTRGSGAAAVPWVTAVLCVLTAAPTRGNGHMMLHTEKARKLLLMAAGTEVVTARV